MGGDPRQLEWGFLPVQLGIMYSENLTDVDSILPGIPTQEIILKEIWQCTHNWPKDVCHCLEANGVFF